jgi:hypothetical protein
VLDIRMAVRALVAKPDKAWHGLVWGEVDGAMMITVRASVDKLRIVLADDLVNRPIDLLARRRAVID